MLLRELKAAKDRFDIFTARVKVQQPLYSQWIEVKISAKNMQEANKLLIAQYGPGTVVAGLRRLK